MVESGPFSQLPGCGYFSILDTVIKAANSLRFGAGPPTSPPQETGSLLRRKVTVPACCSEVSVVTAPCLSEGPSRSLPGTPPGCQPRPGLDSLAVGSLLSDLSVGSWKCWLMRSTGVWGGAAWAGRGQKQQGKGEHVGKSGAQIKGPCSLLPLAFCNRKGGKTAAGRVESPWG